MSLIALVLGAACGTAASAPSGTETGLLRVHDSRCVTTTLHVPADAPSEFVVEHSGQEPVVVTIPRQAISVQVQPGGRAVVPLNPHLAGEFDYYCIDDPTHSALGGHQGAGLLACPLDPGALIAAGSSRGTLHLERHATP